MDWLTFISNVIQAFAWPIAIVVVIVLLRKSLSSLFPALSHLKYKDFEAHFGNRIQKLEREVKQLPPPTERPKSFKSEKILDLESLAELSPRSAILEAWTEVEIAVEELAISKKIINEKFVSSITPVAVARILADKNIIDKTTLSIIEEAHRLRNHAAHEREFQPSKAIAMGYVKLALELTDWIRNKKFLS